MPRFVAFLRAINVGGHIVRMEDLRAHAEAMGLARVETFIASGNVIFESRAAAASLQTRLASSLRAWLGYEVATFVRTDAEVRAIVDAPPIPPARRRDAVALNVAFLEQPLGAAARRALMALENEVDSFVVDGREMYWLCRVRQSDSKFSNAVFERTLKVKTTFRGFNTIERLAAKLAAGVSPGARTSAGPVR